MSRELTVGLFQAKCSNTRDENLANIQQHINQYIKDQKHQNKGKLDFLVLPELHNGPYFCINQSIKQFDRAETIPGPTTEVIAKLAAEHQLVIVASIFEKSIHGLYFNTAVVFDKNGEMQGKYRKMHIPHDPEYNEKYYFSPGDLGFNPIQTSIGKIGVLVCWDQWFPEAARLMALAGAEILVYPTAIGWYDADSSDEQRRQLDAWVTVQRGHAVANNLFVISCNRTGFETEEFGNNPSKIKQINFWGNSFIAGPQGEFLNSLKQEENMIITAKIDLNRIEQVRRAWPFFRDRRTDQYGNILKKHS